jgi:hypothetical protein
MEQQLAWGVSLVHALVVHGPELLDLMRAEKRAHSERPLLDGVLLLCSGASRLPILHLVSRYAWHGARD